MGITVPTMRETIERHPLRYTSNKFPDTLDDIRARHRYWIVDIEGTYGERPNQYPPVLALNWPNTFRRMVIKWRLVVSTDDSWSVYWPR